MKTQHLNDAPPPSEGLFCNTHDLIPTGTRLLGKYAVERTLGQGGMGVVVAARHERLENLVAIKFLLPQAMESRGMAERFLREARVSAQLRSDHIVRVDDVGTLETGEPYMVMEYLEGQDLRSILRHRPLEILEAVEYLLQTCQALTAAHALGVVHRDLKPANLFLTTVAGVLRLKVLDFGIARRDDRRGERLTLVGDVLGTLSYMPPEQILEGKTVDWRADIWALGVVFYQMLTTKRPFDQDGRNTVAENIFHHPPVPLSQWRTDVPPALEAVIHRCLRKDRNERYQSVEEVAQAVRVAMGLAPPVRGSLPSISFAEPFAPSTPFPVPDSRATQAPLPAEVEEETRTVLGTAVTRPPQSVRRKRTKVAVAGGVGIATSTAMVGLVVAMGGSAEDTARNHARPGVAAFALAASTALPEAPANAVEPAASAMERALEAPANVPRETAAPKAHQPAKTTKPPREVEPTPTALPAASSPPKPPEPPRAATVKPEWIGPL